MTDPQAAATREIIDDLLRQDARIAPKYFYDACGSALFEDITHLPEYYPTRTEREIMATHGAAIGRRVGAGGTVIELGAGNCEKARTLCELIRPARFVAVDISADFLHEAAAGLRAAFPGLDFHVVVADLTAELVMPSDLPWQQRLVFYPGSSIGNFDPPAALDLLSRIRRLVAEDGGLLIGIDLQKEVAVLEAAYDDAAGVTAAFNLNVLNHANRLTGSDFDLHHWHHRAFFNTAESRIEMHLEAATDTRVTWPGGERLFRRGERIHTENSYKYRIGDFIELLDRAGFHHAEAWTDEKRWFAVILARP
jgi:L-histidine N-alpha-methyltransferase